MRGRKLVGLLLGKWRKRGRRGLELFSAWRIHRRKKGKNRPVSKRTNNSVFFLSKPRPGTIGKDKGGNHLLLHKLSSAAGETIEEGRRFSFFSRKRTSTLLSRARNQKETKGEGKKRQSCVAIHYGEKRNRQLSGQLLLKMFGGTLRKKSLGLRKRRGRLRPPAYLAVRTRREKKDRQRRHRDLSGSSAIEENSLFGEKRE